jgi:hypothetical protein
VNIQNIVINYSLLDEGTLSIGDKVIHVRSDYHCKNSTWRT